MIGGMGLVRRFLLSKSLGFWSLQGGKIVGGGAEDFVRGWLVGVG